MSNYPEHDCGRPVLPQVVTCGGCGRSWCERCDPAPSALCHWCNGRGYSTAPVPPRQATAERLTCYEYDIEGNYGQGWEAVTCEPTRAEARAQLATYRANEPGIPFRVRRVQAVPA